MSEIVERLRKLVSLHHPENGGPYAGYAAEQCVAAMTEAAETIARLRSGVAVPEGSAAWQVRWKDSGLDCFRTFDFEAEALEWAARTTIVGEVLPLYALPPAHTAQPDQATAGQKDSNEIYGRNPQPFIIPEGESSYIFVPPATGKADPEQVGEKDTIEDRVRHLELYGTQHVDSWIVEIYKRLDAADAMHKALLARVNKLMDAKADTPEGRELDALATIVETYETARFPEVAASPAPSAVDDLVKACEPFKALADKREAAYRRRGGVSDNFPDTHPAFDISAKELPMGVWRNLRSALSRLRTDAEKG